MGEPAPQWTPQAGGSVLPMSMYYRRDPNLISIAASLTADKYESEQRNATKGETWDGLEPALPAAMPPQLRQSGSLPTLTLACLKPTAMLPASGFTCNVLCTLEVWEDRLFLLISVSPERMSFCRHALCCHKQISHVPLQTP